MRIGHTGDLHVSDGPRFADTLRCLDFIIEDGAAQRVDVWTVGGDLSGTVVPHVPSPTELDALAERFQRLADHAPLVVIPGNHDEIDAIRILGRLKARHPITVPERPCVHQAIPGLALFALPFPSKRWAVGAGAINGPMETQKQAMEDAIRGILAHWRLEAVRLRDAGLVTFGLMHLNIATSILGGGEILINREVELSRHDLMELGFDGGGLSHIHEMQEMAPGWWFAGPPCAQNFGERSDNKGYLLFDLEKPGETARVTPRYTPARRLVTVRAEWGCVDGRWEWVAEDIPEPAVLADADVRLLVQVPEEAASGCPSAELATYLAAQGAHGVRVERRLVPTTRVRSEAIVTARTTAEKLAAYWGTLGVQAPTDAQRTACLARLDDLERPDATLGDPPPPCATATAEEHAA